MLSGNPLARQHIAYRGEIVKEPKIKMERNGKDGRRRRKRSARWIDGAWNRGEGMEVRRGIWNDIRERRKKGLGGGRAKKEME